MTAHPPAGDLSSRLEHGRYLHKRGALAEAQSIYEEVLLADARHAGALHLLGIIAGQRGEFAVAAALIGRALDVDAMNAFAYNDQGVALKALGDWDRARASFDRAIAIRPGFAEAFNNRGNLFRELKQWTQALADYDLAITARSGYAEALHNRGVVRSDLHQWSAAMADFDAAIAINRSYANAYCNRGVALEHLDQLEAALESYDRAVALDPGDFRAYANRGNVLRALNQVDAAVASCDRAIALRPDYPAAHQNKAMALLLAGDFNEGWIEYEWRWRNQNSPLMQDKRAFAEPLWLGQKGVMGKTILLHAEQGLGDTLQFCRYASLVARLGAYVILEVPRDLIEVLAGLEGPTSLLARGDELPRFDYHCPLLSLPLAFGTTRATIPAAGAYLQSDPVKAREWKSRLGPKTKPRAGLVWSGGFRPQQPELWAVNNRRNIPLSEFAVLRNADVDFISLQKGESAESEWVKLQAVNWNGPTIRAFSSDLRDFSDTAALIENLDLVISVDTSSAHLAGAMGKPVWLLNRYDTCWRWLLERTDSPWYPTVTLYRQENRGDWTEVMRRVARNLELLAAASASATIESQS